MKLVIIILLAVSSLTISAQTPEPRKVGDWFIVGSENGADGLSPNRKLAIVVETNENAGIPNPKGEDGVGLPVRLVDVDTKKVLWESIVDGDFSWGPLTKMITARWNPKYMNNWRPKGFVLRTNGGRMFSSTQLYLHTEDRQWKQAKIVESPFQKSDYFVKAYAETKAEGEKWYKKVRPPNHHPPGFRHFGEWIGPNKILVYEACVGDLIYRFDDIGKLYLVGFDPREFKYL